MLLQTSLPFPPICQYATSDESAQIISKLKWPQAAKYLKISVHDPMSSHCQKEYILPSPSSALRAKRRKKSIANLTINPFCFLCKVYHYKKNKVCLTPIQEDSKKIDEKLGKNFGDLLFILEERAKKLGKKLGKNRIAILQLIYHNPKISTVEMSHQIGISTTAIDKNIKYLREDFIKHIGPNNGGYWEIITD